MRRILWFTALGVCLSTALGLAHAKDVAAPSCGKHGTAVAFVDSPSEAGRRARIEEKLVLVLHVSGLFEDPKLT